MKATVLNHEFVGIVPDQIDDQTLYVSMEYATVVHKCCCGCGREVVTPLGPTDWTLIYDGRSITLSPSIGNWSFECKSHYWIKKSNVEIADQWSSERIVATRSWDRRVKETNFLKNREEPKVVALEDNSDRGLLARIWSKLWRSNLR